MRPWVRNILLTLCVLMAIAGVAYYWLFAESHVPGDAEFTLDIGELRRLSSSVPGDKPNAIEVEQVGMFKAPATFVVAGDGWKLTDLPVYSYLIGYPHTSVIIDTGLNQQIGAGNLALFDAAAFARMQTAMTQSSLILITHEHSDHIGGLTTHANVSAVLASTRLTPEQLSNPAAMLPAKFPDHALDGYVPLQYQKYDAVAAGMVLIKSPGHTPGSQMIYVQTADGNEFLFTGDVAWHFRNIEAQRERPRFVTQFTIEEDRTAVFGELVALHKLHDTEPRIHIVPGHDGVAVGQLVALGLIKTKFGGTQRQESQ